MIVDELRHDSDSNSSLLALDYLQDLVVAHTHDILPVNLSDEVVRQHSVSRRRRVLGMWSLVCRSNFMF